MATESMSRRAASLLLADELLTDIELSRLSPGDIARKASRLARLLDDASAMQWLSFETGGYPIEAGNMLGAEAWAAAERSHRAQYVEQHALRRATTTSLGELQANIEAAAAQMAAATDPPVSLSSANPNQSVAAPLGNAMERGALRKYIGEQQALLDRVVGAIHDYAAAKYQELRFGAAAETAFEVVRAEVDERLSGLVPDAMPMLAAAFENVSSDNPEHWSNAAATCRRLLKAAADALRPPGPDIEAASRRSAAVGATTTRSTGPSGRKMGDDNYVNRLVDWIVNQSTSETAAKLIASDLEDLGRRLDAVVAAGSKGAHASVDRFDASRFLTGTYLLLGDILRLQKEQSSPDAVGAVARAVQPGAVVPEEGPGATGPPSP